MLVAHVGVVAGRLSSCRDASNASSSSFLRGFMLPPVLQCCLASVRLCMAWCNDYDNLAGVGTFTFWRTSVFLVLPRELGTCLFHPLRSCLGPVFSSSQSLSQTHTAKSSSTELMHATSCCRGLRSPTTNVMRGMHIPTQSTSASSNGI